MHALRADFHSFARRRPSENVWLVPSPSVSVTVVGFGFGWKSSGVPSRISDDACSDQPKPATVSEVSCEL